MQHFATHGWRRPHTYKCSTHAMCALPLRSRLGRRCNLASQGQWGMHNHTPSHVPKSDPTCGAPRGGSTTPSPAKSPPLPPGYWLSLFGRSHGGDMSAEVRQLTRPNAQTSSCCEQSVVVQCVYLWTTRAAKSMFSSAAAIFQINTKYMCAVRGAVLKNTNKRHTTFSPRHGGYNKTKQTIKSNVVNVCTINSREVNEASRPHNCGRPCAFEEKKKRKKKIP